VISFRRIRILSSSRRSSERSSTQTFAQKEDTKRRRVNYREASLSGSLAVTNSRVVTYAFGRRQLHLAYDDPRTEKFTFSVVKNEYDSIPLLSMKSDASFFNPDYQGKIEIQWRIEDAEGICTRIKSGVKKMPVY
jgi:hypothetical protein